MGSATSLDESAMLTLGHDPKKGIANGPAPLYARVKQVVLDRIRSGKWPPNHRVPSENKLVAELKVSRMTANRALRELANEGELVRIRGVGSFVAEHKGHFARFEIQGIADEIAGRGHAHSVQIVLKQDEMACPEVADALNLPVGGTVFHTIIVHSEDDVPLQIEELFVNPASTPDSPAQDFTANMPNAPLARNPPIGETEHEIEARLPQPWECKLLFIQRTEPCIMIRRRIWSGGGVMSLARLLYPGSRYRLESRTIVQSRQ